jgi:hypothetical protein
MKKFVTFLIAVLVMLFAFSVVGLCADYSLLPQPFCKIEITMFYSWFADNWISVSLILSESAALVSGKWGGILKSVVNVGNFFFKAKK